MIRPYRPRGEAPRAAVDTAALPTDPRACEYATDAGQLRRGVRRAGASARPRAGARRRAGRARPRGALGRRPHARLDLHAAGDHVRRRRARRRRPGARPPVPARPRPADHPGRRVAHDQARARPADPRAQRVRRRRLPRPRDRPRGDRPVGADRLALGLRPRRARDPPARRRLLPRVRLRPRARRRRQLEGARGQRPHAERHLLRAGEPGRDDAAAPGAVQLLPRPAGRPLPRAAAQRADRGGPDERRGGRHRRRLDAGPVQLRLLRARVPRAPDGGRARRGVRPRRARRRVLHPHHQRPAARPRDLPADRRRLHGPARVPPRLAARRARPDARLPGRDRGDRQRRRDRRGRRQGRLPPRPRDDPLLPQRGADPRQRADLPDGRSGAAPRRAAPAGRAGGQAGRPVRRQGRVHRPGRERRADRAPGRRRSSAGPSAGSPRSS